MARAPLSLNTVMEEFESYVSEELQNYEELSGTTYDYDSEGTTLNIPFLNQAKMTENSFDAANIPVTDVEQRNVSIAQRNFKLKNSLSEGYQTLFAYDIVQGFAAQHANARGRWNDFLKLDTVLKADAAGAFTVGNNNFIDLGAANLDVNALTDAYGLLVSNGAAKGKLSAWIGAQNYTHLMKDERFTSWFFNSKRPLEDGSFPDFAGFDIRLMSDASPENSIPVTGTDTAIYLMNERAVGVAYNRRPFTRVIPREDEDRVDILSVGTAGGSILLEKAIIKIALSV